MKKILLLLLLLTAFSCAKKSVISHTQEIEKIRMMPVGIPGTANSYDFVIECDPVTNQPKPATKEFKSGNETAVIDIKGNEAILTTKKDSSTVQVPCVDKTITVKETVTKTKAPFWIWPTLGFLGLIILIEGYLLFKP